MPVVAKAGEDDIGGPAGFVAMDVRLQNISRRLTGT
jgi:hypothetical protein